MPLAVDWVWNLGLGLPPPPPLLVPVEPRPPAEDMLAHTGRGVQRASVCGWAGCTARCRRCAKRPCRGRVGCREASQRSHFVYAPWLLDLRVAHLQWAGGKNLQRMVAQFLLELSLQDAPSWPQRLVLEQPHLATL